MGSQSRRFTRVSHYGIPSLWDQLGLSHNPSGIQAHRILTELPALSCLLRRVAGLDPIDSTHRAPTHRPSSAGGIDMPRGTEYARWRRLLNTAKSRI